MLIRTDCEIKVKCGFGDILEPGELVGSDMRTIGESLKERKTRTVLQEVLVKEECYMLDGSCPFKHFINYKMEFDGPFEKEEIELPEEYNEKSPYVGISGVWGHGTGMLSSNWSIAPTWVGVPNTSASVTWKSSSSSTTVPIILPSGNIFSVSYTYGQP